ncbi:hypothetical protein CPJCM30710_19960 [Clostridium polyendosporum]|uniref:Uncharacterized protein n=1 Tax=Clostridium polyendosporum TaxID=69208 RepID=A0A919RZB9_9CLOT|nr:hypothetical protein [Clostridium polyendosporum]GIM29330.1 hypothetical protein CPJCM30710_19960 [Clostridium polyendosporum]
MYYSELKSIIGQNCIGYNPRSATSIMSMGSLAQSCNNCSNFIKGKCAKDLFDAMKIMIKTN